MEIFLQSSNCKQKEVYGIFFFKISDQKLDFTLALSYLNPALNNLAQ